MATTLCTSRLGKKAYEAQGHCIEQKLFFSRAIGQASMTKEYLESVRQGEVCLPDGPVFLNPDSLIHALKREVGV